MGEPALVNRRVLVTGARGFLGSHLVDRLVALGVQVHAVSRRGPVPRTSTVRWSLLDLGDPQETAGLIDVVRPEVVFHLAGEVTGARDVGLVLPSFRSNLQSTVNILTAVAERGSAQVVLAGSLEEVGIAGDGAAPSSPYAAAKWASTGFARMFTDLWGLPIATLRVSMAYGPGQRDRRKLVPYVIESWLEGRVPRLTSGARKVDWVYVDDVVDAFIAAARVPGTSGVMDIGSGSSVSIRDVVGMIGRVLGVDVEPDYGALQDRPLDRDWLADISVARKVIGWRPTIGLEQGLVETVRWYRDSLCASGIPAR